MEITEVLRGKTVEWVATDEKVLVIHLTDGHEVRIKWGEDGPEFAGQSVSIMLPPAVVAGQVGEVGG